MSSERPKPESPGPDVYLDDLERLLFDELERADGDWSLVEATLCREHPGSADAVRRRIAILREAGMLEPPAEETPSTSLTFGQVLLSYEIVELAGRGGMGEVYRARDTKLDRDVAIKVLPREFARDRERTLRFEREAKLLASLNHPNIATIHGFESVPEASGDAQETTSFLVLEFVEGETLAKRLERGPLPVQEALQVAGQIAAALESAHETGVVHRDLKPSNGQRKPDGTIKVLDFGLARVASGASDSANQAVTAITAEHTSGVVFGTAPYMSPEQVRGDEVDERTDVWAFGCVLYELLTGRRAFGADSVTATLAKVLEGEPDWRLPAAVPPELESVLRRCLTKDAAQRLRDIGAARREIEAALRPTGGLALRPFAFPSRRVVAWGLATVAVLLAVIIFFGNGEKPRLVVLPFEGEDAAAPGLSDVIRARLAQMSQLRITAPSSSRAYANPDVSTQQIADELEVDFVLGARVTRVGQNLVTVQPELICVEDDSLIGLGQLGPSSPDELPRQDLAERVGRALGIDVDRDLEGGTDNVDAWAEYHYAKSAHDLGWEKSDLRQAVTHCNRAIDLDPDFALAYAERSMVQSLMYWHHNQDRDRLKKQSWSDADESLKREPGLAEGHLAKGLYHFRVEFDYDRAREELDKALPGLPNDSRVRWAMGFVKRRAGDFKGAREIMYEAFKMDPRASDARYLGDTLFWLREYEEADTVIDRMIKLRPRSMYPYIVKSASLMSRGDPEEALMVLDRGAAFTREDLVDFMSWQAVLAKDYARALALIEEHPEEFDPFGSYANPFEPRALMKARIYRLQDDARAHAEFEKARAYCEEQIERIRLPPKGWDLRVLAVLRRCLGIAYAGLGRKAEARREGQNAIDLVPYETDSLIGAFSREFMAEILIMNGDHEEAMNHIEFLLEKPYYFSRDYLPTDPRFEPLRKDERFQRMMAK